MPSGDRLSHGGFIWGGEWEEGREVQRPSCLFRGVKRIERVRFLEGLSACAQTMY